MMHSFVSDVFSDAGVRISFQTVSYISQENSLDNQVVP